MTCNLVILYVNTTAKIILIVFTLSGLSNKRLSRYDDSLDCFYKLHAILRNSPEVMYQIADLYPCVHISGFHPGLYESNVPSVGQGNTSPQSTTVLPK